jgi:hypothetical protein
VLVVLLFGARWYLDRQWYVGASEGNVAIFQGIPLTILGYELGRPVQTFDDLPAQEVEAIDLYRRLEAGIAFPSLDQARDHVEQIRADLEEARRLERREQQDRQGGNG